MGTRPLLVPWGHVTLSSLSCPLLFRWSHMGACMWLLPNALSWVQCTVKPNNTKTSEFGVERFIAGLCKETGGSCPLKSCTPQRLSAKHFKRQGEGGI